MPRTVGPALLSKHFAILPKATAMTDLRILGPLGSHCQNHLSSQKPWQKRKYVSGCFKCLKSQKYSQIASSSSDIFTPSIVSPKRSPRNTTDALVSFLFLYYIPIQADGNADVTMTLYRSIPQCFTIIKTTRLMDVEGF